MGMSLSERLSNEAYANWSREKGLAELNQILYWCWDPIDVNDAFPSSAGEYDDYALALLARLRKGAEVSDVAAYLRSVERNEMELQPSASRALRQVSERIVNWYEESLRWWLDLRGS
jgi:hypothetical protein